VHLSIYRFLGAQVVNVVHGMFSTYKTENNVILHGQASSRSKEENHNPDYFAIFRTYFVNGDIINNWRLLQNVYHTVEG